MIYITGDTHGDIDFPRLREFFGKTKVSREDYLIVLGDAGIVWSEEYSFIREYDSLGLTVLFIDGNHENFDMLNSFPKTKFCGAMCHQLSPFIYHIIRGEILRLDGWTFFCMGGATSIDKACRRNRISWWEEENIDPRDIANGYANLAEADFRVDYVLTHCAPSFVVWQMFRYRIDPNTEILQKFHKKIEFKQWFFGHYHEDRTLRQFRCFYYDILEIPHA